MPVCHDAEEAPQRRRAFAQHRAGVWINENDLFAAETDESCCRGVSAQRHISGQAFEQRFTGFAHQGIEAETWRIGCWKLHGTGMAFSEGDDLALKC